MFLVVNGVSGGSDGDAGEPEMGAHVILDIVPQRIDPAAWDEIWGDLRALLSAHHAPLLGYDWGVVAGVALPMYTRGIERDGDDPAAHRLTVAGDRATLSVGEQQTIHRDLGRYRGRCAPGTGPEDILFSAAGLDPEEGEAPPTRRRAPPPYPVPTAAARHAPAGHVRDGVVPVLGAAPCPAGCALPLLGAAMVVEARFPRQALVYGDLDRETCEAARRWAEGALGRPIALPVRVDAWRLAERLGARLSGPALVGAVEGLHLATPARRATAVLAIFERADAESWWLARLARADRAEAQALLGAYLEATRDVTRLCGLSCLDGRGPRWTPEALVEVLAARSPRLPAATLEPALAVVFGAGAARLVALYQQHTAEEAPRSEPAGRDEPAPPAVERPLDRLPTLASPADLDPVAREEVLRVACLAARASARPGRAPGRAALGRTIAALLARSGPTLTEEAWGWILREEDLVVLGFLAALAALVPPDDGVATVRRALFENRALCRHAAAASRDEALMAAVAARATAAGTANG